MPKFSINHDPLSANPPSGVSRPQTSQPATSTASLLLVDDEELIRDSCSSWLARSGYRIHTADDGAAAWEAVLDRHFDLVVTEFRMPGLSGIDLVKRMREANIEIPVVLISGQIPTSQLRLNPWLKIGATLLKPFTGSQLLGAIQSVLQFPTIQFDQRDFVSDTAFFALDSAVAHPFRDWGINE